MGLRTKPTVTDGIKLNDTVEGPGVQVYVYEPGNGTRYTVILSPLDNLSRAALETLGCGCGSNNYSVNVVGVGSMLLTGRGYLSADYVQAKLRCSYADSRVLAEFLACVCGREALSAFEGE